MQLASEVFDLFMLVLSSYLSRPPPPSLSPIQRTYTQVLPHLGTLEPQRVCIRCADVDKPAAIGAGRRISLRTQRLGVQRHAAAYVLHRHAIVDDRFDDGGFVTTGAGSYQANAWGLHDMIGNAWEWTTDATNDGLRIARGGSWRDRPHRATVEKQLAYPPWQRVFNVGFRVVLKDAPASVSR